MATFFLLFAVFFLAGISIAVASYFLIKNRRTMHPDEGRTTAALDEGAPTTRSVV